MISKFPPPWNFTLIWNVHKDQVISKFPPPWNFTLISNVHKDQMISKNSPPWNFSLTWTFHKDQMISKFPPPWNFTLTWTVHKDQMIYFFPLLYTLQASISKPMAITNSERHAFDGRTYRRISNQIPIRDPMGSTNPEASGFLITIKRSLNQN